jgi:ribonucleoside-diphosphate reductase alpha chain
MSEVDLKKGRAIEFFKGDELAAEVWLSKYALRNEKSPKDSINRYVKELYRIELNYPNPMSYEEIEELLDDYKYFIIGGSGMFGVGNNTNLSSLSNCFVLGNEVDSYGGILAMDQDLVQVMKRRGGVGIDISHLRSKGSTVNNAAKTSTGAVSFMERFSNTTLEVAL